MDNRVYNVDIYTKTIKEKINGSYHYKMVGIIEAPINKMMKAYPEEFSFMRHQTRREARPSKIGKK
jgi:hypothetical protein